MFDLTRDIDSLTNFKRNTGLLLEEMRRTGEPKVLTVNGKAVAVVQDAQSYQRLVELATLAQQAGLSPDRSESTNGNGQQAGSGLAGEPRSNGRTSKRAK